MPDLVNPLLTQATPDTSTIPSVQFDSAKWSRPTIDVPDNLKQVQQFMPDGSVTMADFNSAVNNNTMTPEAIQAKKEAEATLHLSDGLTPPDKPGVQFRHFSSSDAMRYKSNDRLWKSIGYNPEVPTDITDAMYDHNETKWESIKNTIPKIWSTTAFSFKNYFAEYWDTARAIGNLNSLVSGQGWTNRFNKLHDSDRFDIYAAEQKRLEDENPDYKSDHQTKWYDYVAPTGHFGDAWEESASSLGFTLGTIGAAVTENLGVTMATAGVGELAEIPMSARKVYKAISEYYSLKRAYGLVKGALGAKSLVGSLGSAANLWRLSNGAVSEAAFEGSTNKSEYLQKFKQDYIEKNGVAPSDALMKIANKAGDDMANQTILWETPYLMMSNAVQFGNLIAPQAVEMLAKKFGEKSAFSIFLKGAADNFEAGVAEAAHGPKSMIGKALHGAGHVFKNSLTEGGEESYQALITKSTADYYNDQYFNKDNNSITKSLGVGYDYIHSSDGLKEFAAGFATGSIFHVAGMPVHWAAKPKVRTEEEAKTFAAENPNASEIDKKYKTRFYNTMFGLGMNKINKEASKEAEKAQYENIAKTMNQTSLDAFLKSDGFLDMVKDKKTQFSMAKFMASNDQFNMENAQNISLNRFLYNGLTSGKIDMQINKLVQFASQDFTTLKNYFGLDENLYTSKEDQDRFVNQLRGYATELGNKAKDFENIYEQEKKHYTNILGAAAQDYTMHSGLLNMHNNLIRQKYANPDGEALSDEELEKVISPEDKATIELNNATATESKLKFYGIEEAMKASVFSQVGMKQDAKRAKDIVRDMLSSDTTSTQYHQLGDFFTDQFRTDQEKNLNQKLKLAEELVGSDQATKSNDIKKSEQNTLANVKEQMAAWKEMTSHLFDNFKEGKEYDVDKVTKSVQDYMYTVGKEINNLDSTHLSDRQNIERSGQYERLRDWVQLQKQHQENLNLYNFLSNVANKKEYANYQSKKLTDFFNDAAVIAKEEEDKKKKEDEAKKNPPADTAPPPPPDDNPSGTVDTVAEVVPNPADILNEDDTRTSLGALVQAIKAKDYDEANRHIEILRRADPTYLIKRLKILLTRDDIGKYADDIKDAVRQATGLSEEEFNKNFPERTETTETEAPSGTENQEDHGDYAVKTIGDKTYHVYDDDSVFLVNDDGTTRQLTDDEINDILAEQEAQQGTIGSVTEPADKPQEVVNNNIVPTAVLLPTEPGTADDLLGTGRSEPLVVTSEPDNAEGDVSVPVSEGVTWDNLIKVGNTINYNGDKVKIEKIKDTLTGSIIATDKGVINVKNEDKQDSFLLYQNGKTETNSVPVSESKPTEPSEASVTIEPEDTRSEIAKKVDDFIKRGLIKDDALKKMAQSDPEGYLKEVAQRTNNINSDGKFDETKDSRTSDAATSIPTEITELANETFPQYREIADKADAEADAMDMAVPVELSEVPPPPSEGNTLELPEEYRGPTKGKNMLDIIIDKAREIGRFIFDAVSPKEMADIKDNLMTLKSFSDPVALRHRRVMENLSKIFSGDREDADNYRIKIENTKDHVGEFFQRDTKVHSTIAMIVDRNGNYHYFNDKGEVTNKDNGTPFGVEYEDRYYREENLSKGRSDMAGYTNPIVHKFETTHEKKVNDEMEDAFAPLTTISTLVNSNIPVYGTILGILDGSLTVGDENGTFDNRRRASYNHMRSVKDMIKDGDLEDQIIDAKIEDGYYLEYSRYRPDQRIKMGKATYADVKTGLYIPLTGNTLGNVTFKGDKIPEGSMLWRVIDKLNRTSSISTDDLDENGQEIISDSIDVNNLFKFLKELLYSKRFNLYLSPDQETLHLNRSGLSEKSASLWDAEINFVVGRTGNLDIAFTKGDDTSTSVDYQDFIKENFFSGAVQARIAPGETSFAKIDKRAVLMLDMSHEEMMNKVSSDVDSVEKPSSVSVGDKFISSRNPDRVMQVESKDENGSLNMREIGGDPFDLPSIISEQDLLAPGSNWSPAPTVGQSKGIATPEQEETSRIIREIQAAPYKKSTVRVTGIARPKIEDGLSSISAPLVVGNVIDFIGKMVFEGGTPKGSDRVKLGIQDEKDVIKTLSEMFKDDITLNKAINRLKDIKRDLEEKGYIFHTGIRVYDQETGIGGEVDVLAVDPKGVAIIMDFKTSTRTFDDSYMGTAYDGIVSNKEYFATQLHTYGMIIAKQSSIKVSKENIIIGLPLSYNHTSGTSPFLTKINNMGDKDNYLFPMLKSDMGMYKDAKSLMEMLDIYKEALLHNSSSREEKKEDKRKGNRGTPPPSAPLMMTIADLDAIAAKYPELKAEVDHMSKMLGHQIAVQFANSINKYEYGHFTINGSVLYANAIKGSGYHEGWHEFSQLFLTLRQKEILYDKVRKSSVDYIDRFNNQMNTSDHTDLEIEEFLADEWAKFVKASNNKETYVYPKDLNRDKGLVALFKRMWTMIKEFFGPNKRPTQLFNTLYNGKQRYKRDVNNAMFDGLSASVKDNQGNEILSHARAHLYKEAASYFVGEILRDNKKSFTWLKQNASTDAIRQNMLRKFYNLRDSRLDKLVYDVNDQLDFQNVLDNSDEVIRRTAEENNIKPNLAAMYINQIKEITDIMGTDENNGFNNFYNWYLANTDIASITDDTAGSIENTFDTAELREINERHSEEEDDTASIDEEDQVGSKGETYDKGPNNTDPYTKAHEEIQNFFKTMPIVLKINPDGTFTFMLNELDIPLTYDYASIFSKTKQILAGANTIEKVMERLANKEYTRNFPQAQYILERMKEFQSSPSPENTSFIRRFVNVMGLPEIDNKQLTIDFDIALSKNINNKNVATVRSISRSAEAAEVNQWATQFSRMSDRRKVKEITESSTLRSLFDSSDKSNILYQIDGTVKMNPYFDYKTLVGMPSREFFNMLNIKLNDNFWKDARGLDFAYRVQSLMTKNLTVLSKYYNAETENAVGGADKYADYIKNDIPLPNEIRTLFYKEFIMNPITMFKGRRSYQIGDELYDAPGIYSALEELSRRNSIYSLTAAARSFNDGSGKLRNPYYNLSLLTYRAQILNDINNVKDFPDEVESEFTSLNPKHSPWMENTLFYQTMFDENGDRNTVSGNLKGRDLGPLSSQKLIIEVTDLSSYKTKQNGLYKVQHPQELSAQRKLFFDMMTLFTDGKIEISRASNSKSGYSVSLNSYNAQRVGMEGFARQFLPIDTKNTAIFTSDRFRSIFVNYLSAELQKMKWYFDKNSNVEQLTKMDNNGVTKQLKIDDLDRNYRAHNLNVFKDILSDDLSKEFITKVQSSKMDDSKIKDMIKADSRFYDELSTYFKGYVMSLFNGKEGSTISKMSSGESKVLRQALNLYQSRDKNLNESDFQREQRISKELADTNTSSIFTSERNVVGTNDDHSLQLAAHLFAANQFILNVEYHSWFMGDNYLFTNPFKRGNLSTNTGTMAIVSKELNDLLNSQRGESMHSLITGSSIYKDYRFVKTQVMKDAVIKSKYFDRIVNDILRWEKAYGKVRTTKEIDDRKAELENLYRTYNAVNAADGQSKLSLDSYRSLRIIYGNWDNSTDEREYRRQLAILRLHHPNLYKETGAELEERQRVDRNFVKGLNAKGEAISNFKNGAFSQFNPQKFAYTGPEVKGNSPYQTKFDKTSMHPLIPEMLLGSGDPDETLMMQMAKDDVDYVKFESASKGVKHSDPISYLDQDGKIMPNMKLSDHTPEILWASYLKNQLSTDGMHTDNIFGSQQRVMFFDVKYQPEVQNKPELLKKLTDLEDRYLAQINNIMNYQKAGFYNTFGMAETGKGKFKTVEIISHDRFAAQINAIAKKNNFPANMMEYLKYDPLSKGYKYDPSLIFNRKMLIDTIGGIIDGELRRLRLPGTAAIQVSQMGNTQLGSNFNNHPTENRKYTKKELLEKFGTAGLHYYHMIDDENGKPVSTSTMGIKLTIQGDFLNLLNINWKGKVIKDVKRLNGLLKNDPLFRETYKEQLTFVAYRIPTNNNNFIDHVEVMEFLPASAGNIVIAPLEHIIKSGSDFDVDKLNFIFPSISNNGSMVAKPTEDINDIYNEINKITHSVSDTKQRERLLKMEIARKTKNYKEIFSSRENILKKLSVEFFNNDPVVYQGMEQMKEPFSIVINWYEKDSLINGNTDTMALIRDYRIADKALKDGGIMEEGKLDAKFAQLMHKLASFKAYHTNEMLKVQKETLSDPSYYRMMTAPSNTEFLMAEADRIGKLTGRTLNDNASSTSNMLYSRINDIYNKFMVDAKALGGYSIQRRWFSLFNFSRMSLNQDFTAGKDKRSMKILSPLATQDQEDNMLVAGGKVKLYGDTIDGTSVKDVWDQFMSLTIDLPSNTSYTLLGINNINKKVLQYLITRRFTVASAISFINQPILREVYAQFEKMAPNIKGYSVKTALLDIAKTYNIQGGTEEDRDYSFEKMYSKMYDKGDDGFRGLPNNYVKNPGIMANAVLQKMGDVRFTQEQMDSDIQAKKKDRPMIDRQKKVLLYFMNAMVEASALNGMQFAFSEDRNKDTNYFTITDNKNKQALIRDQEDSDIAVGGSMFDKDAMTRLEKNSIYSPFVYSKTAQVFYKVFGEEFTKPQISGVITYLLNASDTFGIDKQLLATRMEGDYIEYIYKNFGEINIMSYDPMTNEMKPITTTFSEHFLKTIFNANPNVSERAKFYSYSDKLNRLIDMYPELRNIGFVERLYPEGIDSKLKNDDNVILNVMDTYNAVTLRFARSQDNTIAERNRYAYELQSLVAFNPDIFKLVNNYSDEDIAKISAFFTELCYLSLYQAGPTNIADNFSDLIPMPLWREFVNGAFDRFTKSVSDESSKEIFAKTFGTLYRENNPKVPWKNSKTYYNLNYFGRDLNDTEREFAKPYLKDTKYFLNYRAGKMYDVTLSEKKLNFDGLKEINC